MARKLLFLVFALASCSKGAEADLQYISEARSLAAEWAMVNEQANQGHLTGPYVRTMRRTLREQLQTTAKALTQPQSRYGQEVEALTDEPADAAPDALRSHVKTLKQIENGLESA